MTGEEEKKIVLLERTEKGSVMYEVRPDGSAVILNDYRKSGK